jgi:hypothetical protein
MNQRDREIRARVVFIPCDLFRHAAHLPYAVPFVPATNLAFTRERPKTVMVGATPDSIGPLVVGHLPSSAATKGTALIRQGLEASILRARLRPNTLEVIIGEPATFSHTEATDLRRRFHVYVDQMNAEIGGFGASAVEAMAIGATVIADVRNVPLAVERFFKRPPIKQVSDEHDLEEAVWQLCTQPTLLADLRRNAWDWACNVAGYEAHGRYVLQHLWARSA